MELRGRSFGPLILPRAVRVAAGLARDWEWVAIGVDPFDARIDTGASRSCAPLSLWQRTPNLPWRLMDTRRPVDWRGMPCPEDVPAYLLRVEVVGEGPLEIEVYSRPEGDFLLGRDVLARLLLVLDGPARQFRLRRTFGLDRWIRKAIACP